LIASETWWKTARALVRRASLGQVSFLPLLLVGCVKTPPPQDPAAAIPPLPPTPPASLPPARESKASAEEAITGLRPLATPQQVIQSVELGRPDPFGRLLPALPFLVGPDGRPLPTAASMAAAAAPKGRPAGRDARPAPLPPLQLPRNFSLSGVILSEGVSEAVVSFGDLSGSLRTGDRGGRTTDLLPPGWSVAAIDVQRGVLILQKGGQKVSAEL
jgi:hypothetical protein